MNAANRNRLVLVFSFAVVAGCLNLFAPPARCDVPATLEVDVSKPGPAIPPRFAGLMTEEINHAYDGGLFAELIQNRSFQDRERRGGIPIHWSLVGSGKLSVDEADPVNAALPLSLRLDLDGSTSGVGNDGYWGIPVRPDTTYVASFYAKGSGGFAGPITASLLLDDGSVTVTKADTAAVGGDWKKYTISLTTGHDAPATANARFVLSATGSGSVSFSMVSLFPPTYQNTPNGLRPDLMKLLADLQPKFIRLPGGNYLEGNRFSDRFNWKKMIGPADHRPGHMGCWSYRSSDGFGLPEYLLWCKQLGAEPVLAVFAGYTLNGDHMTAGDPEMATYTKEALEEIEYVSGSADSEWGKKRAADGFPEPFSLHYVEIGNEDWFDGSGSYDGRFTEIAKAIREKYPQLKLIATAPVKSFKPDLYDDHFYRDARTLTVTGQQYAKADGDPKPLRYDGGGWTGRHLDGTNTFVGEWATQEGQPTPDVNAGLADAAFVMGLEQSADNVEIECYAPLLVNVNPADKAKGYPRGWQWPTNLIGYDALHSFGSPSYYTQVMLAQNRGDVALTSKLEIGPAIDYATAALTEPHGGIGFGSWHTDVEYTDISVTGADGQPLLNSIKDARTLQSTGGDWKVQGATVKPGNGDSETWAITGDPEWTDYTVKLRARKLDGREGFMIIWHATDGENYRWWNIGGWGNTVIRAEVANSGARTPYGDSVPFTVEPNRWYDLKLEVHGKRMRGFIDGKLISDITDEPTASANPVNATATYITADHTVIVKVVNAGASPVDTAINIRGVSQIDPQATAIVLSGEPKVVNTLEEPTKVSPKTEEVTDASTSFHRVFPPYSLTVLRLKASEK